MEYRVSANISANQALTRGGMPPKVGATQNGVLTIEDQNDIVYSDALRAARHEALELDQEIVQLRKLLNQLEARKMAVDEVCTALGRWVELSATPEDAEEEDTFDALFEGHGGAIRLSEEEVSLIAYPDGPPDESPR